MRLEDKVAIVTGAASGIGNATVHRFIAEGAKVIALDLDQESLSKAFQGIFGVTIIAANVTRSREVDAAVESTVRQFGHIDIMVNAAGISGTSADLAVITDEEFAEVVEVNLYGVFYCVRAATRAMRSNRRAGGSIINISSVGALANFPLPAAYPASKAGVLGLTRATAALLAVDNIRVNAVAPGATDTPMLPEDVAARKAVIDLGVLQRSASADEIANTILFLASDESAFFTGQTLSPNGGYVMA